jgi:hypothetical protein
MICGSARELVRERVRGGKKRERVRERERKREHVRGRRPGKRLCTRATLLSCASFALACTTFAAALARRLRPYLWVPLPPFSRAGSAPAFTLALCSHAAAAPAHRREKEDACRPSACEPSLLTARERTSRLLVPVRVVAARRPWPLLAVRKRSLPGRMPPACPCLLC